jgi:uncharacterized protein YbjT (DUF2867 family)
MYTISGASGNTGKVVAETLLARGEKVRAIGRSAERLQFLTAKGAEPFVSDFTDARKLTEAFRGAEGVYVLLPPNFATGDYRAYQDQVSDAIATAVRNSGAKRVVSLSSIGADKPSGTGPVVGLHNLEQKLNRIDGVNVLHLRAAYFMENTLAQAGAIRTLGMSIGPLRADLEVPMIATRDIGAVAVEALLNPDFAGKQTRELQGQRDLDYAEAAAIIGKAIGKPGIKYVQGADDQMRKAFVLAGLSEDLARLILEMAGALNSGHMKALEPRSTRNTTPTSFETFVIEEFVPVYEQQAAA